MANLLRIQFWCTQTNKELQKSTTFYRSFSSLSLARPFPLRRPSFLSLTCLHRLFETRRAGIRFCSGALGIMIAHSTREHCVFVSGLWFGLAILHVRVSDITKPTLTHDPCLRRATLVPLSYMSCFASPIWSCPAKLTIPAIHSR